jgi:two-component system, OmpR family, response regulator
MAKILVIEDDPDFAASIAMALRSENHTVEMSDDGEDALHRMASYSYDLIICDWMLPSVSGVEICAKYRAHGGDTLILMLTGKSTSTDIQTGLESGADDYLVKPFHTRELLARVGALLRRSGKPALQADLEHGPIKMNPNNFTVSKSGAPLKLSKKEFALLELFLKNPDRVFALANLLRSVWADTPDASEETVRTHIKTLRKKLQADGEPDVIVNIHGQGYRLNNQ